MDLSAAAETRARERLVALGVDPGPTGEPLALVQIAGDAPLRRGLDLTVEDLAQRTGLSADEIKVIYNRLGVRLHDASVAQFDDEDVGLVSTIATAPSRWVDTDEIGEVLRVVGRAMATAAGASVGYHLSSIESRVVELVDWIDANYEMGVLAVELGGHLGAVYRHHLRQVVDLQRVSHAGTDRGEVLDLAVAFVDLTGFTGLSSSLDFDELGALVTRLDEAASTAAEAHGCRVVKLIGDEAMFVGASPAHLVAAAHQFMSTVDQAGVPAHGAATFGQVLMSQGDYYGPVVNLAARLVDHAQPGELLGDAGLASHDEIAAQPDGTRIVRGIGGAVPVYLLER